jgi:hypothetical protein
MRRPPAAPPTDKTVSVHSLKIYFLVILKHLYLPVTQNPLDRALPWIQEGLSVPSLRQIKANQLNAQHSTGPRTEAGKAVSRLNALKSGIDAKLTVIPGEDPLALEQLTAEYIGRYHPVTPEARALVDILITSEWQLRRLRRAEAILWEGGLNFNKDKPFPMANVVINHGPTFDRLQRRINSTQRNFERALAELRRVQADPQPAEDLSEPQLTLVPATTQPQIGFIIAEPQTPPSADPAARLFLAAQRK